ncbi:hypothetical protein ACFVVM_16010 [Nocardia sp. NPDC058176]|uniref:hypothetical protein n=1 Tax=Nocardia sp. NPDC058176 TaxID=3346368 RepID=UPI0036D8E460
MIGSGAAALHTGNFHTRTTPRRVIEWLDYPNDGRYLHYRSPDRIRVCPGGNSDLDQSLAHWIEVALREYPEKRRERAPG